MLKQFKKTAIITLTLITISFWQVNAEVKKEVQKTANRVAVLTISGVINDAPKPPTIMTALQGPIQQFTFLDIVKFFRKAENDKSIKAIVLDIDNAQLGLAQLQELRQLIKNVQDSGHEVWLHCTTISNGLMIVGSVVDHLSMTPEGNIEFNGIYAQQLYFKGLLDKLKLKADVIHVGEFKSFGENYYRTGPSAASLKQTNALLDSIYQQIINDVANGCKITTKEVLALIDTPIITPKDALQKKMIDSLLYRSDFLAKLKDKYGFDLIFDFAYGQPKKKQITGFMDLLSMFSPPAKGVKKKNGVGVVFLEGAITSASIREARREILKAAKDDSIKALVFRVNSPGGSALASDILCNATQIFKKTDKPFIVSMGNSAASGGYYISAFADIIFAEKGTITGSIGVVGMKIVTAELLQWSGVTTHAISKGKYASLGKTMTAFTKDERQQLSKEFNRVYATFKKKIMAGRGVRIRGDLEKLAGGRVYTGEQAKKVGLIDLYGGLNDAIEYAAGEAGLPKKFAIRQLPEPKEFFEQLNDILTGVSDDEPFFQAPSLQNKFMNEKIEMLKLLFPTQSHHLNSFLEYYQIINRERLIMATPEIIINL